MIRPPSSIEKVYLCGQPFDFRKTIKDLSIMIEYTLGVVSFSSQLVDQISSK